MNYLMQDTLIICYKFKLLHVQGLFVRVKILAAFEACWGSPRMRQRETDADRRRFFEETSHIYSPLRKIIITADTIQLHKRYIIANGEDVTPFAKAGYLMRGRWIDPRTLVELRWKGGGLLLPPFTSPESVSLRLSSDRPVRRLVVANCALQAKRLLSMVPWWVLDSRVVGVGLLLLFLNFWSFVLHNALRSFF